MQNKIVEGMMSGFILRETADTLAGERRPIPSLLLCVTFKDLFSFSLGADECLVSP
jgi:hypothetical protein